MRNYAENRSDWFSPEKSNVQIEIRAGTELYSATYKYVRVKRPGSRAGRGVCLSRLCRASKDGLPIWEYSKNSSVKHFAEIWVDDSGDIWLVIASRQIFQGKSFAMIEDASSLSTKYDLRTVVSHPYVKIVGGSETAVRQKFISSLIRTHASKYRNAHNPEALE